MEEIILYFSYLTFLKIIENINYITKKLLIFSSLININKLWHTLTENSCDNTLEEFHFVFIGTQNNAVVFVFFLLLCT